jgi:hypothetical protein
MHFPRSDKDLLGEANPAELAVLQDPRPKRLQEALNKEEWQYGHYFVLPYDQRERADTIQGTDMIRLLTQQQRENQQAQNQQQQQQQQQRRQPSASSSSSSIYDPEAAFERRLRLAGAGQGVAGLSRRARAVREPERRGRGRRVSRRSSRCHGGRRGRIVMSDGLSHSDVNGSVVPSFRVVAPDSERAQWCDTTKRHRALKKEHHLKLTSQADDRNCFTTNQYFTIHYEVNLEAEVTLELFLKTTRARSLAKC